MSEKRLLEIGSGGEEKTSHSGDTKARKNPDKQTSIKRDDF